MRSRRTEMVSVFGPPCRTITKAAVRMTVYWNCQSLPEDECWSCSSARYAIDDGDDHWGQQACAWGLSPRKISLSPHRETDWSKIRRWIGRKCSNFNRFCCSQNLWTVSANCFSFWGENFVPRSPAGSPPLNLIGGLPDPLNYSSPQTKILGAAADAVAAAGVCVCVDLLTNWWYVSLTKSWHSPTTSSSLPVKTSSSLWLRLLCSLTSSSALSTTLINAALHSFSSTFHPRRPVNDSMK